MAPVVHPNGLVRAAEMIDLVGPVEAGTDQAVAKNQRLARAFDAVVKVGPVAGFKGTVSSFGVGRTQSRPGARPGRTRTLGVP